MVSYMYIILAEGSIWPNFGVTLLNKVIHDIQVNASIYTTRTIIYVELLVENFIVTLLYYWIWNATCSYKLWLRAR